MSKNISELIKQFESNKESIVINTEVETFLDDNIKEYGFYVIETRALPSIMDGLRVGARKIFYGANNLKRQEKLTILVSEAYKLEYHHGDASLQNTVEFYGSEHVMTYKPFEVVGQIGTMRVPETKTAARYLSVKKSPYFDLFTYDSDLYDLRVEEGKLAEPKMLYPILPMHLLQRTGSPGFGFSYKTFEYRLEDVINNTILAVANGTCDVLTNKLPLKPHISGINPDNIIYNHARETWYNVGDYEIKGDTLIVRDLPFNISYSKYEQLLNTLEEQGIIKSWYDRKKENETINYEINFYTGHLKKWYSSKWKFYSKFGLYTKIPKPHLNVLDLNGKTILHYEDEYKLIDAFVIRRLNIYRKRKQKLIVDITNEINDLVDKSKFIKLIIDGKLTINNRPIEDIKKDLKKFDVSENGLKLRISKLTKDEYDEILQTIEALRNRLEEIKNTSEKEMYISELVELSSKYLNNVEICKIK